MDGDPGHNLALRVGEIFTPSAPIDRSALFAGRTKQIRQVVDAINQRGQHAIIFGERGVGKTSLANILADNLTVSGGNLLMPHINCDTEDDYTSLWKKIFSEIVLYRQRQQAGFDGGMAPRTVDVAEGIAEPYSTGDIRTALAPLAAKFITVIVLDEFDRLPAGAVRSMLADTIKMLSDRAVGVTLIIIGVAFNVDDLIAEHESIARNLIQVPMPRMSRDEIADIVNRGLQALQMTIEPAALANITQVSQGLPHYTHLLARLAARNAVDSGSVRITRWNVARARVQAVEEAQRTTGRAYHQATSSPRRDALHKKVLLACALTPTDELGFFAPADVRDPLNKIAENEIVNSSTKRSYDIANYLNHLSDFCDAARGSILKREGASHRRRYRFADPMMQPYVILKGFTDGWLVDETAENPAGSGD